MTAATTNAHVAAQQILPLEHLDLLIGKHPLDFRRPHYLHGPQQPVQLSGTFLLAG
jgi:hypothetical protein